MVANGSGEPREIFSDPMIAGSRGEDGCEFDLEVDLSSLVRSRLLGKLLSIDPQRRDQHFACAGKVSSFPQSLQNLIPSFFEPGELIHLKVVYVEVPV